MSALERATDTVAFAEWCEAWGLACPTGDAPNVPTADGPWTAAQWQDLMLALKAVGDSPTNVALMRPELDDARIVRAAEVLGFASTLEGVKERVDGSHVSAAALARSQLAFTASEAAEFPAASGLRIRNELTAALAVDATGGLDFSGISLAGPDGDEEPLREGDFTSTNVMSWQGDETGVTGMPIRFFFTEAAGRPDGGSDRETPGYRELVPQLAPLKAWLTTGRRDLDLNTAAFTKLAAHVPNLIADPAVRAPVGYVLRRLTALTSTAASRSQKLLKATAMQQIQCRLGNQAMITFEAQFGVTSLTPLSAESARLNFFGILVKPLSGIVRPNIRLTDVDLEPTRIVVRNVPVIGSYVIDMTDPGTGDMSVTCG